MKHSNNENTNPIADFETLYQKVVTMINAGNPEFNTISEDLKKAFLNFKNLFPNDQLDLIGKLSLITDLPKEMDDVVKKFPYFNTLPDELLKQIGSYIEPKDTSALLKTDKRAHTLFQPDRLSPIFLQHVVYGEQDKAENILTRFTQMEQKLLGKTGTITDYSGRTFHCTAYEYAYWAKDTHMCRMLEQHMDENTKAQMLERCEAIETNGLTFQQHGVEVNSQHFDFTPLKEAMQNYINGHGNWDNTDNWDAKEAAWMQVGIAQRDLPVHVVNEYCWEDRSFSHTQKFNEDELPRKLTFYNYLTKKEEILFPLVVSNSAGLGINFALFRGVEGIMLRTGACGSRYGGGDRACAKDLAAVGRLDEVRTADLTQSRENLKPVDPVHELGR